MGFRVRVAGLLVHADHVLLAKHRTHPFWILPGGKLEERETLGACVEREIFEEAGLKVRSLGPIFLGDFLSGRKHVLDVFFRLELKEERGGLPPIRKGADRNLEDVKWFPVKDPPPIGPPPFGNLLLRSEFRPEAVWGKIFYGGPY